MCVLADFVAVVTVLLVLVLVSRSVEIMRWGTDKFATENTHVTFFVTSQHP